MPHAFSSLALHGQWIFGIFFVLLTFFFASIFLICCIPFSDLYIINYKNASIAEGIIPTIFCPSYILAPTPAFQPHLSISTFLKTISSLSLFLSPAGTVQSACVSGMGKWGFCQIRRQQNLSCLFQYIFQSFDKTSAVVSRSHISYIYISSPYM